MCRAVRLLLCGACAELKGSCLEGTRAPVPFVFCCEKPKLAGFRAEANPELLSCGEPRHQSGVYCGKLELADSNPEANSAAAALWGWCCPCAGPGICHAASSAGAVKKPMEKMFCYPSVVNLLITSLLLGWTW